MKKWLIAVALFFLILVGWGAIHFWPMIQLFSGVHYDTNAKPDWKVYENPEFGISFESPYTINWDNKNLPGKEGRILESGFGITSVTLSGLLISSSSMRFKEGSPNFNSDNQLKLIEGDLNSSINKEPKWENQPVTCSGMPATLTSGSYTRGLTSYYFSKLLVTLGSQNWTVEASQQTDKGDRAILDRIIRSVKITPKP